MICMTVEDGDVDIQLVASMTGLFYESWAAETEEIKFNFTADA